MIGETLVGRYRIISKLGEGGMGVTYRAWDELSGLPVVVKRPKQELAGVPGFLERFHREVEALVRLAHPHIVSVLDVGMAEQLPFYVMRFLPGGSLADRRLRDGAGRPRPMQPSTLHLWLWQIVAALDSVHAGGVVHRDVKPANIFFDASWNAFLGDFGVVTSLTPGQGEDLTATHAAIGTDKYMAPEQLLAERIDGRADQHALGVIAYELTAGRKPFTSEPPKLLVEIATQSPPPLQSLRPDIPASFSDAVHRALAKNPAERFPSCAAFATALLQDVPPLSLEIGIGRFLCPNCRTILRLPVTAGGERGRCSRCRERMVIAHDLSALWLVSETQATPVADVDSRSDTIFAADQAPAASPPLPVPPSVLHPAPFAPPVPASPPGRPMPVPVRPVVASTPQPVVRRLSQRDWAVPVAAAGMLAVVGLIAWSPWKPSDPLAAAWATLESKPEDPTANDVVGRCLATQGEWPRAIGHLMRSRRSDFGDPARAELAIGDSKPADPGSLLDVAGKWWKLARRGSLPEKERRAVEAHAASLYLEAVPRVTDLGDAEAANDWLDRDQRFRQLVHNRRPALQSTVRVREVPLRGLRLDVRQGTMEWRGQTLAMRPGDNREARATVAVPPGATAITGHVYVEGASDVAAEKVVFQVAKAESGPLWQSRTSFGKSGKSEIFSVAIERLEELEIRVKIRDPAAVALWADVRFLTP